MSITAEEMKLVLYSTSTRLNQNLNSHMGLVANILKAELRALSFEYHEFCKPYGVENFLEEFIHNSILDAIIRNSELCRTFYMHLVFFLLVRYIVGAGALFISVLNYLKVLI